MITRREAALKWAVTAACAMALFFLHSLTLSHLDLWGVTPFLPPILIAVLCSIENDLPSIIFSLIFGVLCDLALGGLFPCLYTVTFFLSALLILVLGHSVLQPGFFCALISAAVTFLLVAVFSSAVLLYAGSATLGACASLFARELFASLLWLPLCYAVFSQLHKFFTV